MSRTIYETAKLKDPLHKQNFSVALKNSFETQAWMMHGQGIEISTAPQRLKHSGEQGHRRTGRAGPSTWNSMEERRQLKHSIMNCRSERVREKKKRMYQKGKEVKNRARADNRRTLETVVEVAERAAHQNNPKELFIKTKLLSGCLKKTSTGIRTKDGKVITTEGKVLERWKEHFYEILNVACEGTDLPEGWQLDDCEQPIEVDTGPFTIQELRRAISRISAEER